MNIPYSSGLLENISGTSNSAQTSNLANAVALSNTTPTSATSQDINSAIFFKDTSSNEIRMLYKAADGTSAYYTVATAAIDQSTSGPILAPTITIQLTGSSSLSINQGGTYTEQGAIIYQDGISTGVAATVTGSVDTNTAGDYTITYSGSTATAVQRTVSVTPVAPSVIIQLTGGTSIAVERFTSYIEQGARIIANGVDVGPATVTGTVDNTTVSSYSITYSGSHGGVSATPVTRAVNVQDLTAPILTLNGPSTVTITQGGSYAEQGVTSTDGPFSFQNAYTSSGTVDVNTIGIYTITYNGTDDAGNAATPITRTVNVVAPSSTPSPSFSRDFTSASISGTNLMIGGTSVGTLAGSNTSTVTATSNGVSTNTTSYIALTPPSANIGGDFTWELVCKLNAGGSWNAIIGAWDGGFVGGSSTHNISVERWSSTNQLQFWTRATTGGGHAVHTTNDVLGGSGFLHVVVTHTNSASTADAKKIYINGSSATLTDGSATRTDMVGTNSNVATVARSDFVIGRTAWTSNDNGVEVVKYFRHYNSVLTQSDVTSLYNAYTILPPTAARYYEFRNATINGSTLQTSGGNGTITGSGHSIDPNDGFNTVSSNYVTFPSYNFGTEWSMEVYFKMKGAAALNQAIFGAGSQVGDWIQIGRYTNTNKMNLICWNGQEVNATSSADMAGFNDTFGHVVITYSQTSGAHYYMNGSDVTSSFTDTGTGHVIQTGSRTDLRLGSNLDSNWDTGEDVTRRLAIYSTKLNAQEVTTLYNQRDVYTALPTPSYARDLRTALFDTGSNQAQLLDSNQSHTVIGLRKNSSNFSNVTTGPSISGGLATTTDTYVDFGTITLGPPFTIEVYGKVTTNPGHGASFINLHKDGTALNTGNSTTSHIAIDRWSTIFKFMTHHATGFDSNYPQFTPSDGAADHHIVVTYNGTTKTMYVDGSLVNTDTATALSSLTRRIIIGRNPWNDSSTENIKYFKIWDVAVTAAQVNTMYSNKDASFSGVGVYSA